MQNVRITSFYELIDKAPRIDRKGGLKRESWNRPIKRGSVSHVTGHLERLLNLVMKHGIVWSALAGNIFCFPAYLSRDINK